MFKTRALHSVVCNSVVPRPRAFVQVWEMVGDEATDCWAQGETELASLEHKQLILHAAEYSRSCGIARGLRVDVAVLDSPESCEVRYVVRRFHDLLGVTWGVAQVLHERDQY